MSNENRREQLQSVLLHEVVRSLESLAKDPMTCANELEKLGLELIDLSKKIKEQIKNKDNFRSVGGMGDFVSMSVLGPDGKVKQQSQGR